MPTAAAAAVAVAARMVIKTGAVRTLRTLPRANLINMDSIGND